MMPQTEDQWYNSRIAIMHMAMTFSPQSPEELVRFTSILEDYVFCNVEPQADAQSEPDVAAPEAH